MNYSTNEHGDVRAYALADIPVASDSNWENAPLDNNGDINFSESSNLNDCKRTLDFTYFETEIDIPFGTTLTELKVTFSKVDDGARAYIFNTDNPDGAFIGQIKLNDDPVTEDYSSIAKVGEINRLVIVQFDDCRVQNNLKGAKVIANGEEVEIDTEPEAANDNFTVDQYSEDNTLNVLSNDDYNRNGPHLTYGLTFSNGSISKATDNGSTITVNNNGTTDNADDDFIEYTPLSTFSGVDSFSYIITDTDGDAASASVSIRVNSVTLGYSEDFVTVNQDSSDNIIDIMANDSDDTNYGPNDTRFLIVSSDHITGTTEYGGTVTLETYNTSDTSDDVILYTPRASFVGTDTFNYVPGSNRSALVLVTITVEEVNIPDESPTAVDDTATFNQNSTNNQISVLTNDSFGGNGANTNNSLTFSNGSTSKYTDFGGYIVVNDNNTPTDYEDDYINYNPASGFSGTDTFDYIITDSDGDADSATVTITVGNSGQANSPTAADDAETVNENATEVEIEVLDNDISGSDGYIDNGLTATNGTQQGGTLEDGFFRIDTKATADTTDDVILYTPKAEFIGTDTFQYTITDASGDADTATVTVTVEAVTDVPNANDDTATTAQDTAVTINVTDNDTYGTNGAATSNSVVVTSAPTNGTASVVGDDIEYTPNTGFVGTDTFTYAIEDSNGDIDSANVTVTVTQRANGVPVANDDTVASIDQNSVANTIDVLANDDYGTDGSNDDHQLTFSNGGTASASNQGGAISVVSNTILYSPATDFVGQDKFTYVITDKNGDADNAEVTITVEQCTNSGELGILDLSANGGINPMTNQPWKDGDTYRLVFISSTTIDATSTDIDVYNTHVQNAANNVGLGSVNWYAIASTTNTNALVNTKTSNLDTDGAFFKIDGSSVVSTSISDFWDGKHNYAPENPSHNQSINLDENGNPFLTLANGVPWRQYGPTWTGTNPDGTSEIGKELGQNDVRSGLGCLCASHAQWVRRGLVNNTNEYYMFAVSEVLSVNICSNTSNKPEANNDNIDIREDEQNIEIDVLLNDDPGIEGYINNGLTTINGTLTTNTDEGGIFTILNQGTPETNDDKISYTPEQGFTGTDTFQYTITDASGDASIATVTVTVASVVIPRSGNGDTSVSTTSSSFVTRNDFTAYPNPSTGYVKTTIFSTTNTEAEVLLFDITGKVILRKQTSLTIGKNDLELSLNVKPGIMLLRVQSPDTNYGTTKIVFK